MRKKAYINSEGFSILCAGEAYIKRGSCTNAREGNKEGKEQKIASDNIFDKIKFCQSF